MPRSADLASLFPPLVERRRAPRLPSELWLRVHGVETRARLRSGDLSARGLHAVLDLPVGGPGDLVSLRLGTADRRQGVEVLARVTRVLREDDLHHGAAV
ncbi:MAG: PilZ domain-containing protein, partial [Deltaproteobacteria bacterium]|nr:PilZ domain-containing protein [Deltaproteobacteria bacterium]